MGLGGLAIMPSRLHYPTTEELKRLVKLEHIWKVGDSYSKIASKHYGDPKLWWVIAWFNKRPTETHCAIGDKLYIPTPLGEVIRILKV
jgi:nucleoid-associated protein YgaU